MPMVGPHSLSLALLGAASLLAGASLAVPPMIVSRALPVPNAQKPGCARENLAATARGVFYFAPTAGSEPNILNFDTATSTWGAPISITGAGAGVVKSIAGSTMAAVESVLPGIDDFLVFGGGAGSNAVTQYNLRTKAWTVQAKTLSHVTTNLCSIGCLGYAFFATGDFKAAAGNASSSSLGAGSFKPGDRQIQRYNLTNGQMEENNMEKTRAGGTCACWGTGPTARVFFAGGQVRSRGLQPQSLWRTPTAAVS